MADLFESMRGEIDCVRGGQISVLSESTSTRFLENRDEIDGYPFLRLFFVLFNDPDAVPGGEGGFGRFITEYRDVFGVKGPEHVHAEAAGGYDAFKVVSKAVNSAVSLDTDGRFGANEVFTQLAAPGVIKDFPGATGVLTLDRHNKYPPDKAVYVVENQPQGKWVVRLACGHLADRPTSTTWGTSPAVFRCPVDE
jgi:ABC-type branched-subunit amino acid transport system substrate-binding protein